jgi:hypothetical protein
MFTGAGKSARKENAAGVIHTVVVQNSAWHNFYIRSFPQFSTCMFNNCYHSVNKSDRSERTKISTNIC